MIKPRINELSFPHRNFQGITFPTPFPHPSPGLSVRTDPLNSSESANLLFAQISSCAIPPAMTEGWQQHELSSTNINYLCTQALRHETFGFGHADVGQELHFRNSGMGIGSSVFHDRYFAFFLVLVVWVLFFIFVRGGFEFSVNQLLCSLRKLAGILNFSSLQGCSCIVPGVSLGRNLGYLGIWSVLSSPVD